MIACASAVLSGCSFLPVPISAERENVGLYESTEELRNRARELREKMKVGKVSRLEVFKIMGIAEKKTSGLRELAGNDLKEAWYPGAQVTGGVDELHKLSEDLAARPVWTYPFKEIRKGFFMSPSSPIVVIQRGFDMSVLLYFKKVEDQEEPVLERAMLAGPMLINKEKRYGYFNLVTWRLDISLPDALKQ